MDNLMGGNIDFYTFPEPIRGKFTNVDGMREVNGHVLLLEKKHVNCDWQKPLPEPQLRCLQAHARHTNGVSLAYICEDDTDVRAVMVIGRPDLGLDERVIDCTTEQFHALLLDWDRWAKTHSDTERWQPPVWLAAMAACSKAA